MGGGIATEAWASRPWHSAAAAALALPATYSAQSFPYPSMTTLKPPPNLPNPLAGAAPALACGLFLSWRGAVQPVQAFPPPRSRRPSCRHRLGFKMSTQKNQSCATGGNTYTGSYITAIAANHFILNEPNPIPADFVCLGVFICAFCKCICGIWQDWARGCRCRSSHINPHYCHRYFSSIAHFSNWQIKQSFCVVPANLDIYCRFWPG